jgi:Ca2+-binding EF-hand superfamily protein
MQISSLSVASLFKQMQALLSSSQTSSISIAPSAGQDLPTTASLTTSATASAAPALLGSTPSQQFSSDLLATLISAQAAPPSASNVAGKLISNLDTNGDGTLSLSEVEKALSNGGAVQTSSAATASLTSAFNKIDTNGDGQISQSELTTALQTLVQDAQSQGGNHHHHHHSSGGADQAQAQTGSTNSTAAASTTSTSAAAATTADTSPAGSSASVPV